MDTFKSITLRDWRQFDIVNIDLSNQVTILTGVNGCGKTTILNVLSKHFGWSLNFVCSLQISKKKKKKIWSDVNKILLNEEFSNNPNIQVGQILYEDSTVCNLVAPFHNNPQYQLNYQNLKHVIGLHIPSHRPAMNYQRIDSIPVNPKDNQQHYQEFQQLLQQTYGSSNVKNPGIVLKQSLISLALFGFGNETVVPNEEYKKIFYEFQEILKILMPPEIGFEKIEIRVPDVMFVTKSGDFSLDAMSGGINALFGIAWQIHMYGVDKTNCTVIIDEPENHLHPSMQRSLIPSLSKAFPKYKFIIATHSPFIVSSLPSANVYGLIYNDKNRIESLKIEGADLSGSANKILREILDVPSTIPIWVEEKIREVIKEVEEADNDKKADIVFNELDKLGLTDHIAEYSNKDKQR